MKHLTLDNWKEQMHELFNVEEEVGLYPSTVEKFIEDLLVVQNNEYAKTLPVLNTDIFDDGYEQGYEEGRQALKDEAVKRIEEEKAQHDHSPEMELARLVPMGVGTLKTYDQALSHAQDIIRNL